MVAVFVVDRHLHCDFINPVAELLTGLSAMEARGRSLAAVICPANPKDFDQTHIARVLATGGGGEGEETLKDRGGVKRPFSFRVMPLSSDHLAGGSVIELTNLSGETGTGRALRESERRLRLAIETTGIGIWEVNAITGERRWSDEFKRILGLPTDAKADDQLFASLIHPDDRDRIVALYRKAYEPGSSGRYAAEHRIIRADDGTERWVTTTGRISFDGDGKAMRGVGTLSDIHQRRENEQAVRESEERLRVALVAGRMGTWRYDLDTGEQKWDTTQRQIFGVGPAVEPTRELFRSMVHPEDLPKVDLDLATLEVGTFLDSEFRITRPDGQIRWISASALARADASGKPVEMIGVNRDITAQKEAEAALKVSEETHRLAVAANDVGTWDYDMVTGEHRWSAQFRRLWGLPADAPADPDVLRALVDEREWEAARRQWSAATRGDGRIALEFPIRRADDNERRWCMFNGQIFFDEIQGTPARAIGIMLDVTDRREAEEQQRLIVRELNHRVKNTLAVVQAIVSQTIRLTKKPSEAFDRIQARLMSISRTHDFLSMSNWSGASLDELLRGELDPYASGAERVNLHGPFVRLHSTTALALGLVFHEMATNAAKYGSLSVDNGRLDVTWTADQRDGQPEITITWRESGGPRVREPRQQGFGSRLIEGSIAGNLGGSLDLDFAPEGLRCVIRFAPRPLAEAPASSDGD